MEENRFEKQVQQKMDELKIQPSESVWKKIEAQIEKKSSSKRGLLILFLLFGLLFFAGYFIWDSKQQPVSGKIISEKNTKTENSTIPIPRESKNGKSNAIPGLGSKGDIAIQDSPNQESVNKNPLRRYKISSSKKIKSTIIEGEQSSEPSQEQNELPTDISTESSVANENKISHERELSEVKPGDVLPNASAEKIDADSASQVVADKAIMQDFDSSTKKQTKAIAEVVKKAAKNKWKFGITFSGGISNIKNNFLSDEKAFSYTQDPSASISVPIPQIYVSQPSAIRNKFGFTAGVFAEKNLSSKTSIVLGLNFKSFNTSHNVTRSSPTLAYSGRSAVYTYNSHYNFLELPANLKIQIGNGKVMPLFWEGGLTISQLINSNALQFNSGSGNYYDDNSVFNKTQFGLNTAISLSLFSKKKSSLLIGPHFYYGTSKIANEGLYNNKHFVYTSLQARYIFGK